MTLSDRMASEAASDAQENSRAPKSHEVEVATSRAPHLLERLLPDWSRTPAAEDRRQARVLVGLSLVILGIATVVIYLHALYGTHQGVIVGFGIGACGLGLIVGVRGGIAVETLSRGIMWVLFGTTIGLTILSGGESVPAIIASSFIPLLAAMLDRPSNVTRWTLAALGGVGVAALYAAVSDSYLFDAPLARWEQFRFLIMAVTLVLVYAGTLTIDWARGRALEEAHSTKAELDTQGERYRSLVENVGDVIMEYDHTGGCIYVSPNSESLTGVTEAEMMGTGFQDRMHPADLRNAAQIARELRRRVGVTRRLTVRFRHADDHWIYGQMSARCFNAEDGSLHLATIFRDVTDLRRAELQIRHSERLATAGTLAAGIAHQINNPIGSIRNSSEYALLCARDGDLGGVEEVLEGNIEQATRCGEIVRSLLQFASREAPNMIRHNLVDVVRGAREFTTSYAGERGIDLAFEEPARPVMVNVSAIEIEQVIVNLLRNAIESNPASKRVSVAVTRRGSTACCMVRDDGCGISEIDQAHVFDPFFTTRISDGGSGLGLSVAHGIVRDHGGTMTLVSTAGKGTEVSLELPISPEPASA